MSDPIEDYIRANRDKFPREVLTQEMEKVGHARADIDAAWERLPAVPDKTSTGHPVTSWNTTPGIVPDEHLFPKDILVRTYRAKNQVAAAAAFQADAAMLSVSGYRPISQSWAQGQWGCGAFLIALLLCVVLVGFLIFIYLLVVKPEGILTVTYQHRAPPA